MMINCKGLNYHLLSIAPFFLSTYVCLVFYRKKITVKFLFDMCAVGQNLFEVGIII